jgi:5'-3' exonuclease
MRLLIDLDGILFRCMLATKDQGYYQQLRACYTTVDRIMDKWDNPEYLMALSGTENFRKTIYPEYKANRNPEDRPRYLWEARQYFIKYYGAQVAENMEADDLVAMNVGEDAIVISNDKDYLQVAGAQIYNPWKDEMIYVDDNLAHLSFFTQLLVGDSGDNIPGLKNPQKSHFTKPPNFTKPTATEILQDKTKDEMQSTVIGLYQQVYGDDWFAQYDLIAQLLYLRRGEGSNYTERYL